MINTNDQAQSACGTIPVATGVNIMEEQTSAAGDAHGVPTADTVENHDHVDESATSRVANTVNIIAPAPPVEAENESQQALLSIIQT